MVGSGNRRQRRGRGDRKTTELASTMRSALEHTILLDLFPRAQIGVNVQVLQADGGVMGACINAAMLALANAGMRTPPPCALCPSTINKQRQHGVMHS